jgi:hypothetical protein
MNSQDFEYLSREIESIRRELGAGIPVPEKKVATSGESDTISFQSMKDYSGASATGWANRYMDGDRGVLLSACVSRALEHCPASAADEVQYARDLGLFDSISGLTSFCYDGSNTGDSLDLFWYYGTGGGVLKKSNAIALTKVSSSIGSNSLIGRVMKISEINSSTDITGTPLPSTATISTSITTYSITDVVSGSGGSFSVSGDQTAAITTGTSFFVTGSTGNDKIYSASSSSYDGGTGKTTIIVSGSIASGTADGSIGVGGTCLMWNPMKILHALTTVTTNPTDPQASYLVYSKTKNAWLTSKRNYLCSFNYVQAEGVYFEDIGQLIFLCGTPFLNAISVPDSYIPKGHVCLQPISPGSKTIHIRLRHITTGDIYEGSVISVYDGQGGQGGNITYGLGTYYQSKPDFLYPDTNADLAHGYVLSLTMTTL